MVNAIEKIFAIFLALLVLILAPVVYTAMKADSLSQVVVNRAAQEFIDKIKTTGCLSTELYQRFIKELDTTENIYTIELTHERYQVEPVFTGGEVTGVHEYFINEYTDGIMDALEADGVYYFRRGDYVNISVRNRKSTIAERLLNIIFRTGRNGGIQVTYGGLIRDSVAGREAP